MKFVADANVLPSAVLGGQANKVLRHAEVVEVLTTEVTLAEVQEYAVVLARKKRLSEEALLLAAATLPVLVVERVVYAPALPRARKLMGERHPDDVDILALALHTKLPLWSNDNDFEDSGVEWFTTAELLKRLGTPR